MQEQTIELKVLETNELYQLNPDTKGILRINPVRDKKEISTWAAISDFEYTRGADWCPYGVFISISPHMGRKHLVLEFNTQSAFESLRKSTYEFFDFNDFNKALSRMQELFLSARWKK